MASLNELAQKPIEAVYTLQPGTVDFLKKHARPVQLEEGPHFKLVPAYAIQGLAGSDERMYLREALQLKLMKVAEQLPEGSRLVILDAFRTRETQRALFEDMFRKLTEKNRSGDMEQVFAQTNKFVVNPYDRSRPLPHNSGGAVDLGVVDRNGKPWDFGTEFDDPSAVAATNYFEDASQPQSGFSKKRWQTVHENRRALFHLMKEAGFTNNKDEWWHFDLGDHMWAKNVGQPLVYEPMEAQVNALKRSDFGAGMVRSRGGVHAARAEGRSRVAEGLLP